MGVPTSKTDVCNIALSYLGQPPVANIESPTSATEKIIAIHYDNCRRTLLRQFVWNFAKKRALCTRQSVAPPFDYTDGYTLPNDFIRFLNTGDREDAPTCDHDVVADRTLLLNTGGASSVKVRYIANVEDPYMFDPCFLTCLAYNIAIASAYAITKKKAVVEMLSEQLKAQVPDAVTIDGQERPPKRIERSKLLAARKLGVVSGSIAGKYTYLP